MAKGMLSLYHQLPHGLKTIAAGVHGHRLRRVRYGKMTEELAEQALERDRWLPAQWAAWQDARMAQLLHRAATRVPFYRELWAQRRRAGDMRSWDVLEHWPVLEKESLRREPRAFVADDCDYRTMVHDHTSGTTGTSLSLWLRKETVQAFYALFEARCRRWYGVSREDRWAIIGGQLVTPVNRMRPPFWVWNAGMKQLYLSSYHLAPQHVQSCLDALVTHRVRYILGYSSSLYALATGMLDAGRRDVRLEVAITNAEPLLAHHRATIEAAFGCPVRETYGMAENVAAATECEAGAMHLWPELGHVEVFNDREPAERDATGALVCTGLLNLDMPLIRYRVGDLGRLHSDTTPCACGRTLPRLSALEGRIDDVLFTRDGRRIGRLDPIFKDGLPVREAQIIQETLQTVRVRYVPTQDFRTAHGAAIVERLQDRMGNVQVILEAVAEIPRSANGKFRAVVCKLPPHERVHLAASAAVSSLSAPLSS